MTLANIYLIYIHYGILAHIKHIFSEWSFSCLLLCKCKIKWHIQLHIEKTLFTPSKCTTFKNQANTHLIKSENNFGIPYPRNTFLLRFISHNQSYGKHNCFNTGSRVIVSIHSFHMDASRKCFSVVTSMYMQLTESIGSAKIYVLLMQMPNIRQSAKLMVRK